MLAAQWIGLACVLIDSYRACLYAALNAKKKYLLDL